MPKRQRDELTEVSSSQQIVDKLYSLLTAEQKPEESLLHNLLNGNWENIDSVIKDSPTINLVALLLDTNGEITQRLKIATELVARCNHTESNIKTETQECITTVNSNISKNSPLITLFQNNIPKGPKISKTLFDALDGKYKEKVRDAVKDFKITHPLSKKMKPLENYINQSDNHTTKIKKYFLDGNCENIDSIANIKIKRDFLEGNCENIDSVIAKFCPRDLVELLLSKKVVDEQRLKIADELVARCRDKESDIRTKTQKYITEVNRNISENPPLIVLFQKNIPKGSEISRSLFDALDGGSKEKVRNHVENFAKDRILGSGLKAFEKYINKPDHPTKSDEANSCDEVESISLNVSDDELPSAKAINQSNNNPTKIKKYFLDGNCENIDSVIAKFCPRDLVELLLSTKVVEEQRIKIATELVARCKHQDNGIRTKTQECITEVNSNISKNPPLIALFQKNIPKCTEISKMLFNALDYGSKAKVRNDVENFKSTHALSKKITPLEKYINQSDNYPTKSDEANSIEEIGSSSSDTNNDEFPHDEEFEEEFKEMVSSRKIAGLDLIDEFPYGGELGEMFFNIQGLDWNDQYYELSGEVMMDLG